MEHGHGHGGSSHVRSTVNERNIFKSQSETNILLEPGYLNYVVMNYRQFMAQWLSVESFTTKDPSSDLNQVNFFFWGGGGE